MSKSRIKPHLNPELVRGRMKNTAIRLTEAYQLMVYDPVTHSGEGLKTHNRDIVRLTERLEETRLHYLNLMSGLNE
jgi:hypothetical protein